MMESNPDVIRWTRLTHAGWSMYIAATEQGLCYVGSQDKTFDEMAEWVAAKYPGAGLVQDDRIMKPYVRELEEYLQGKRDRFEMAMDYKGTPFQKAVWRALCQIPYGKTMTYTDIAQSIGKPAAVRAVGAAIGANPLLVTVPCHRVIGKNGALTGYRGGLAMKSQLLELERKHEQAIQKETAEYV
ncbi:methylated-DNA--[protein]-cysteine S-methyltransferase [Paenibacillus lactis]